MKIVILSLPLHTNYGGIIQSYALQTVLQKMGHEIIVIDKDRIIRRTKRKQFISFIKFYIKKVVKKEKLAYKSDAIKNFETQLKEQNTRGFINKYINILTIKNLEKDFPNNIDTIIVGSDQVWRRAYYSNSRAIENAFLKFIENTDIKRVSYAASFGIDYWDYSIEETKECARLLKKFDAVSVRELSAINLCKEKLGVNDVHLVLDPTMLLQKEDYLDLAQKANVHKSNGNLMCYVLHNTLEKQQFVEKIAKERGLQIFRPNVIKNENLPLSSQIQPPIENWIQGFNDAEFIFTDSFHACVFSIIFKRPFIVFGKGLNGLTRISSLLELFSLSDHLLLKKEDYNPNFSYIITNDIYDKIELLKSRSMDFLKMALEK